VGWRGDGGGVVDANPPASWSPAESTAWVAELPEGGHGSPVVVGEMVCVTCEPTWVLCVDRRSGELQWRSDNEVAHTFPEPERSSVDAQVAMARELDEEMRGQMVELSRLRRASRSGDGDLGVRLTEVSARVDELRAQVDQVSPYRSDVDIMGIGYASPTLVSDGERLFALFGNGVLSSYSLDGTPRWSVWLGPPEVPMRGYSEGITASPRLVGDSLIVGYGQLLGVDPSTGTIRWRVGRYRDYGTPATGIVHGVPVVATPDGHLYRATDGEELASNLGDLWYIGPLLVGDTLYYAGGSGYDATAGRGSVRGWRLHPGEASGELGVKPLFDVQLPVMDRFYAGPVVYGGSLYLVSDQGVVVAFDALSGELLGQQVVKVPAPGRFFSSPVIASDRLWVTAETGYTVPLSLSPGLVAERARFLEATRATPTFLGDRVYIRGNSKLWALE